MKRFPNPLANHYINYNNELLLKQQQEALIKRQYELDRIHNYKNRIVRKEDDLTTPEETETEESETESEYPEGTDDDTSSIIQLPEVHFDKIEVLKQLAETELKLDPVKSIPSEVVIMEPKKQPEELLGFKGLALKPKNQPKKIKYCDLCCKSYSQGSFSQHKKTKYHLLIAKIHGNLMNNLMQEPDKLLK